MSDAVFMRQFCIALVWAVAALGMIGFGRFIEPYANESGSKPLQVATSFFHCAGGLMAILAAGVVLY